MPISLPPSLPPPGPTSLPYSFLRSFLFHPYRPPPSLSLSLARFPLSLLPAIYLALSLTWLQLYPSPRYSSPDALVPYSPSFHDQSRGPGVRAAFPLSRQLCLIDGRGGSAGATDGNGSPKFSSIAREDFAPVSLITR